MEGWDEVRVERKALAGTGTLALEQCVDRGHDDAGGIGWLLLSP